MLLAVDTSHGTSVAIVDRDGGVLAERSGAGPEPTLIGDLIRELLAEAGAAPTSLSGVALGIGPGSDERLAVGFAAAHGFAAALGKPVVRVVSHDAAVLDRAAPATVVTRLDSGGVVWTAYDAPDEELGLPTRRTEPAFADGLSELAPDLGDAALLEVQGIDAGRVGMLAERLFAGGRAFARREPYGFDALRRQIT